LSDAAYRAGDFVWTAFPERENPARPGPRHVGYVAATTASPKINAVLVSYTSSQPWHGPTPPGVYSFDLAAAAAMGQSRGFTLDLRRLALIPITREWFPDLSDNGHGVIGRAPERLRVELEAALTALLRRGPENAERLRPNLRR